MRWPGINRNGNLQITQFYYGAAQPSNAAAQIAGALFYGSAQDNGGPSRTPTSSATATSSGTGPAATPPAWPPTSRATARSTSTAGPAAAATIPTSSRSTATGRTHRACSRPATAYPTPDPQWPFTGGANFAVNPVNGQDVVISSAVGRIFATTNQGVTWFDIGDPAVFDSPGSFSVALAYGAPDPNAPEGIGNLGNFIYVGTATGQIYVTQDGGGSGTSNNWLNISLGLDGSTVQSIITDPTRGSHDAYAVTSTGVFYHRRLDPAGEQPHQHGRRWVNITGNIQNLAYYHLRPDLQPDDRPELDRRTTRRVSL